MSIKLNSKDRNVILLILMFFGVSLNFHYIFDSNTNHLKYIDNLKTSDQEITIITPENITYTEPMEGYYSATYGFENDEDGSIPDNWSVLHGTGGTCQVISELGGHKKVLEIYDNVNGDEMQVENYFTPQNSGSIEWWWRVSSTSAAVNFNFWDNSNALFGLLF